VSKLTQLLFLGILVLGSEPIAGGAPGTPVANEAYGKFDRMQVIERFLLDVYPAMQNRLGQLTFEVEELNLVPARETSVYVDFAECHVGSGVPGAGQPRFRYCPVPTGGSPITDYLLRARFQFGDPEAPLVLFWAHGALITAKLDMFREQISKQPQWTDEQVLAALERAGPRFAPEQRDAFIKQVPLQLIQRYTGCILEVSKARFLAHRTMNPPDPATLDLYWEIPGSHKRWQVFEGSKRQQMVESCFARFEPFEGNLITIDAH
jgi:hypothetical protein